MVSVLTRKLLRDLVRSRGTLLAVTVIAAAGSSCLVALVSSWLNVDRARAAGGTVVQEPGRGPDGDMRGGISDGNGTTWWISTHG